VSSPSSSSSGPPSDEAAPDRLSLFQRLTAFETVLIAGGFVLFLVLLYEMEVPSPDGSFLTPPLVAAAGAILLWPLRHHYAVRALLFSGGFLLLLWFVDRVSGVLIPFVSVYLIAYLLNPAVERLDRRFGVPRWLSSLGTTVFVVGGLVVIGLILVPNVINQIETLSTRMIDGIDALRSWLAALPLLDRLEGAGLIDKQTVLRELTQLVQTQADRLPQTAERLVRSLGSILGVFTLLAIAPVLLFYTLKDYPAIKDALIGLFPTAGGRRDYLVKAGTIVGSYLRGQIIISLIAAFNVSVALLLLDVPFGLLIGVIGGLLNFVPNLGTIVTMALGGLIAFLFGGWVELLIVVAVLLGQAALEQSILTPNILGYQVGVHPVLVLLSLLVFGAFMGVFGLFIAVPATALLLTGYRAYREELTLELSDYGP
jgi:predicted PurR-regulated permease PerM